MKKYTPLLFCIVLAVSLSFPLFAEETTKKPIDDIADIIAWKSIQGTVLSRDGLWLAYYLAPQEGNGEIIIRHTRKEKEYRYPIGEPQRFSSNAAAFSHDSQWVAWTVFPTRREARQAEKQKKPAYNATALLNLASGEKKDFEQIKAFRFSGENPDWLALHTYPDEDQSKGTDTWKGSDLMLIDLINFQQLNFGNVSEFAFNKKGKWLSWAIDARDKNRNGVQLRDTDTGVVQSLDSGKAEYSRLSWTEDGDALAVIKAVEHDDYDAPLHCVLGFTNFTADGPEKIVYDPHTDDDFPPDMTISPNRDPQWTENLDAILFGIHDIEKKEEPKEDEKENEDSSPSKDLDPRDLPDVVIWHWKDKRLQSMQQVQSSRDENFSYLSIFRVEDKTFIRLADDDVRDVSPAPKHRWAIGYDNQKYLLSANLEGRRYRDIYVIDMHTGEKKPALERCRWSFSPSPDGTRFLYYQNGHFFTYDMPSGKSVNITRDVPVSFIDVENDHNVKDPPIRPVGWSEDGKFVLLSDKWDVWKVPAEGGNGVNITGNGREDAIRYQRYLQLDPEEKGIDLSRPLYFTAYGEWTKKAGIALVDTDKPGAEKLLWDDAFFSLMKARNADVYLYTRQTYEDYPDYYVTGRTLKNGRRITRANPQQEEYLWSSGSLLIDYESEKGDRLQGALFLPADYQKGKRYPAIVYYYEKLSQSLNRYTPPRATGFNKSVYTSRGYAVFMPDITYKINDPGMSAVWCVLPAVEAAVETGVVDPERIGIHGHSWGGYQTAFLITQTGAFKAAVAGAPLTNMISMYSSIYWNTGSANQPIFESSQGRFKGNYLENTEAYTRNSPVYHAGNVTTPLIILHNDKDGAVDWNQGIEYFNTLRQMRKPVVMLQYKGENHGLRKPANQKDYFIRMMEFFDHHLRGKPAPEWWKQGVPHLELQDHIETRTRPVVEAVEKKLEEIDPKEKKEEALAVEAPRN